MITLIEAKNYRCLQYIRQPLGPFHVLVGPNASGKTTFLDVVAFLRDFISGGLDEAVAKRTQNYIDLIWGRHDDGFEFAVEVAIPEEYRSELTDPFDGLRYEFAFGVNESTTEFIVKTENLLLTSAGTRPVFSGVPSLESEANSIPSSIITTTHADPSEVIFLRDAQKSGFARWGTAFPEYYDLFEARPRESILRSLPRGTGFDLPNWLTSLLFYHLHLIDLNSAQLRRASPAGLGHDFKSDGSNLPWTVEALRAKSAPSFQRWIAHLQTALPDLVDIETVERDDDRHRYLVLCYEGGLRVPSWMASDGTLRLIALTIIAYLPDIQGVYLIEEPENGIHPCAIESMFQSLSSVYDAQVLLATHSPVILSVADISDVLCFSKTAEGAAEIVSGNEHPALINWHGETNLGVLFAGGVLG